MLAIADMTVVNERHRRRIEEPRKEQRRAREQDYGPARVGVAIGLTLTLIALLIIDSQSIDYAMDAPTLGFLLTSIALLLGVEGLNFIRGK